eukprot:jgi/Ulvmu1/12834/UM098_0016.1
MPKNRVCYFYDDEVSGLYYGPKHPMKPHRITMTHHLVLAYELHEKFDMYVPRKLDKSEFLTFHSQEFIDFLEGAEQQYEPFEEVHEGHEGERFGIDQDCPVFPGLFSFCRLYAGASVEGARKLASGQYDIAINWAGGLHHGKRSTASGFCYVNDLVLAIVELLRVFPRVLYIDIDIHHGDGVEEAFYLTDRVMTCSFHKGDGFFPGTGEEDDIGEQLGYGYSVNIPLKDGTTDKLFHSLFGPIITKIIDVYDPGAIVLQCGADSLAADRLGNFSMTISGHCDAVKHTMKFQRPLLITGGGGYTKSNVARCWTNETAALVQKEISPRLPPCQYDEYFSVKDQDPTLRLKYSGEKPCENMNKAEDINRLHTKIMRRLEDIRTKPTSSGKYLPDPALVEHYLQPSLDNDAVQRLDGLLRQHKYLEDPNEIPLIRY